MLPFWGPPAYLYEAVDSVLAQDSDEWRLTIVDDHYPDESVAEHFAALGDERIRYIRNEVNLGITDNYRKCLSLVEADFMMFMGGDDVMEPGFLRAVQAGLTKFPQADIVQPGVQVIDEDGTVYQPLSDKVKQLMTPDSKDGILLAGESIAVSLLHGDWLYWPSLVFRTEAIRRAEFLDGYPLVQDLGIVLQMLSQGARMIVLPQVVFNYRRHQASASSAKLMDGGRFAGERSFFALQAQKMAAVGWRKAARAARAHLTSRAYALTLIPQAVKAKSLPSIGTLLKHATSIANPNPRSNS